LDPATLILGLGGQIHL